MKSKGFQVPIKLDGLEIKVGQKGEVVFDCEKMQVKGNLDEYAEDFRDHLRRNGIKIYTGKPFKSILPLDFRGLKDPDERTMSSQHMSENEWASEILYV